MKAGSRPQYYRIRRIVQMVREGAETGCLTKRNDFMREFEMSRRTVARDLDFLRDEERAPLTYDDMRDRFSPETYARQAFGMVGGEERIKVRLLFEPKLAIYITECQCHSSQEYRTRPDGHLETRMETTGRKELARWILSWRPDVKVRAPKSLPALSSFLSVRLIDRRDGHRAKVLEAFHSRNAESSHDDTFQASRKDRRLSDLLGDREITPKNARETLATLPTMSRADLQEEPARHAAAGVSPVFDGATGGSTGTPMRFRVDRNTQAARESSLISADHMAGWSPRQRIAMLWGSDRDVRAALSNMRLQLCWWVKNRRWYNAFDMGSVEMAAFHRAMSRFRPDVLVAYAGAVLEDAKFFEREGFQAAYPESATMSSAEVLTADMRRMVENLFRKPVFDRYGKRKFGAIAAEGESHEGLHVNETDMLMGIDSPNPEPTPGPVIITYFQNRAMPLVRYDTGDHATRMPEGPCACGGTTRRLRGIIGRRSDVLRMPDGRLIHGEFVTHLLYDVRGETQFRFIQEDLLAYPLLLVTDDRYEVASDAGLRRAIADRIGPEYVLAMEHVESISGLATGKYRFTESGL